MDELEEQQDNLPEINQEETINPEEIVLKDNHKRGYVSDKEYVLYLGKGSEFPDGFISIKNSDLVLTDTFAHATRMTSCEATRYAVEYKEKYNRLPVKFKITNYKDYTF